MTVEIHSFGFKYGLPDAADLIFDVRFMKNPYWIEELRELTGLDAPVSGYVFGFENSREFADRLFDFMSFLMPQYAADGRGKLVAAVGCTGGRHRSVAVAEQLAARLDADRIFHRDINIG